MTNLRRKLVHSCADVSSGQQNMYCHEHKCSNQQFDGIPQNGNCFCHLPTGIGSIEGNRLCLNCHRSVTFNKKYPLIATHKKFNIITLVANDGEYQKYKVKQREKKAIKKEKKKEEVKEKIQPEIKTVNDQLCYCPCPYSKTDTKYPCNFITNPK